MPAASEPGENEICRIQRAGADKNTHTGRVTTETASEAALILPRYAKRARPRTPIMR